MGFIYALMIPIFTYCDCVNFALDSYSLRKLRVAFNACFRFQVCIYQRRLFVHISEVSDTISECSLVTYMVFWLACFIFSLVTLGRPLSNFSPSKYMVGSVLVQGIRVKKSLPVFEGSSSSFQGFKRMVCEFLEISA
jgi:hypothetical protein